VAVLVAAAVAVQTREDRERGLLDCVGQFVYPVEGDDRRACLGQVSPEEVGDRYLPPG